MCPASLTNWSSMHFNVTKCTKYALVLCLFVGLWFGPTGHSLQAGGPVHGAKAGGMGSAFVAVADDPSAILHNPAGIARIKGNVMYGGTTAVFPYTSFEDPAGNEEETDFQIFFPSHLFHTFDFQLEDIVFGVGLYSPFGIGGRKWSDTGSIRFYSLESWIATFTVNPTIAYEVSPSIFVAGGIDYMKAFNKAERAVDQSPAGAGDARLELEADGDGWGYNLGLLFEPAQNFRIGFAYRSSISVDFDGDLNLDRIAPSLQPLFGGSSFQTDIATESEFPEIYSLGFAYLPDKRLTLALDIEWVRWSSFFDARLDIRQEVPAAGLVDTRTLLEWDDSLQIKLGVDYQLTPKNYLRGGYAYVPTAVPDNTIEPGNPDADSHNFSIGFGYQYQKWTADVFYTAGIFEERQVDNTFIRGVFENIVNSVGVSIGYRFR
ncbi:MAG: outer membrane protein transport protein [Desulfobulbaceae bacterium]|nr:outer membrane protein transport protein [Desulfobulbaceae bacterium]